jgi:methylated-DNA-protein-cysteine methyltransferase-like protein
MDFYKRVVIVCQHIPYGKVATYGQIALLCQKPKASRQVGYGLSRKITEEVNAHRVINSQGYLSGAGAFDVYHPQRRLLEEEGVEVSEELRVDLKKYGWKNTLDEALLLEALFKDAGI